MTQYIDKSALVEEIERRRECYKNIQMIKPVYESNIEDFNELLSFINTLEVKEVDLEKESLTWDDIGTIDQLLWDLFDEHIGKSDNEEYYKAVLSRFKAQKRE